MTLHESQAKWWRAAKKQKQTTKIKIGDGEVDVKITFIGFLSGVQGEGGG